MDESAGPERRRLYFGYTDNVEIFLNGSHFSWA